MFESLLATFILVCLAVAALCVIVAVAFLVLSSFFASLVALAKGIAIVSANRS